MTKTYLFILLFTISSLSFSQTKYDHFDKLISKADSLRLSGDNKIALKNYTEALKIITPNSSTPFFDAAACALKMGNENETENWIRKGVSIGGAPLSYLKTYKGFEDIQNKSFYLKAIADYNLLRQQYFSKIKNIDVYLKVEEIVQRDQFARKLGDYLSGRSEEDLRKAFDGLIEAEKNKDTIAIKKYQELLYPEVNKETQKKFSELVIKIDSVNIEELMAITKEYGWQKKAWIILWHQRGNHDEDNYVWNYFRPLINKEIEEGKISRSFWKPFDEFKKRN
jgi:hypothetical protein